MNKILVIKYLKNITLLTLIILLAGRIIFNIFGIENAVKHLYFLTGLFFVVSGLFHFLMVNFINKKPQKFIQVFLILTVAKIILYLSILVAYIFKMEGDIKSFLFTFLTLYLSYTAFEVVQLTKSLKNKGLEDQKIK